MSRLGYVPIGDVHCTPRMQRVGHSHHCELELVFVAPGVPTDDPLYWPYWTTFLNGCDGTAYAGKSGLHLATETRPVAVQRGFLWPSGKVTSDSNGRSYACPAACKKGNFSALRCPFK